MRTARFFSDNTAQNGTPFADLGDLTATEVRYDAFSSALFDLAPVDGGHTCVFATSTEGPFECDIAPLVQSALDDGRDFAQLRLAFDLAGDNDSSSDLALFFITDTNTNEPGIFGVDLEIAE